MTIPPNVAAAMRQLESGGNYSAKGPVVKKGSYAGDRAYGAYQVMGNNIPSWTKEALGQSLTKEQFLASRDAQDKVFEYKFGQSARKHGNYSDAASIWHSGRTLKKATAAGANDGYMQTKDYVSKFEQFAGGKGVSAKAQQGWASGIQADTPDTPDGNVDASGATFSPFQMKMQAFNQDLQALAELKRQADITTQVGQQGRLSIPPPKINTPIIRSSLMGQPLDTVPAGIFGGSNG